jgi:uncharacterized membrane protein YhdT
MEDYYKSVLKRKQKFDWLELASCIVISLIGIALIVAMVKYSIFTADYSLNY